MMPAPLRFVGAVLALWICARAAMLVPGAPEMMAPAPAVVRRLLGVMAGDAPAAPGRVRATPDRRDVARTAAAAAAARVVPPAMPPADAPPGAIAAATAVADGRYSVEDRVLLAAYMAPRGRPGAPRPPSPGFDAAMAAGVPRWSGDAYLFLRDGGAAGLAPGAQLGGGQAFARLAYRLDETGRLAATARVSRALGTRQTEGAVGLRRTIAPGVAVTAERRVALDAGGRSAWAAFVAGGVDGRRIGPVVVDGYAQAGVVGARRRDGFVDGGVRAGRPLGVARLGLGTWGAAQPGAARLDVGPQAVVRLPAGLSAAVDWRVRVAGDARPGSGVAVTLAAGF
jgi:hypothetical protein